MFQYFFNFNHRVGVFLITELAVFCSVIWRKTIWEDGALLFGRLAKHPKKFKFLLQIWQDLVQKEDNLHISRFASRKARKYQYHLPHKLPEKTTPFISL